MPVFLASLLGGLISIIGSAVPRVLVALGISVVTYSGLSVTLGFVKEQALSALDGLPADMVALLAYMGVGQFINIITSALLARMVLDGLQGDTMKRWVKK
ncbi:DUF2523 domain-containing protein [Hydrogenophaga sp. PML113]|uniref:DUF2523 domain-containing protein n=1 Tax=Hydrogenophaga sp. PML113 TaxID=1899350 RepID=UPI000877F567|nr:DUF2523 domain-containing protein [Hydrogenophaga sp. PML113]